MSPELVVFGYGFPHLKSQDIITKLVITPGIPRPREVRLAPWRKLKREARKVNPVRDPLGDTFPLCVALGLSVMTVEHSVPPEPFDLGIVAGARILPKAVIDRAKIGILNAHPGMLPQVRGLDAIIWSILEDVVLGVTFHLIDEHVDLGRGLYFTATQVHQGMTLEHVYQAVYNDQITGLPAAALYALEPDYGFGPQLTSSTKPFGPASAKHERMARKKLPKYLERFG